MLRNAIAINSFVNLNPQFVRSAVSWAPRDVLVGATIASLGNRQNHPM